MRRIWRPRRLPPGLLKVCDRLAKGAQHRLLQVVVAQPRLAQQAMAHLAPSRARQIRSQVDADAGHDAGKDRVAGEQPNAQKSSSE